MSGLGGKREKKAADGDGAGWILTYGDMVTLLLAFFVMLFATSSADAEKFDAFVSGLGMFGNPNATGIAVPQSGPLMEKVPAISPGGSAKTSTGSGSSDSLASNEQFDRLRQQVQDAVDTANLQDDVLVEADPRGVAIVITTDNVLFERGSARLTSEGEAVIAVLGPILAGFPNQVQVEGHSDNSPLRRKNYSNWNLSTDRAVAVVEQLAEAFDIASERLTASGFGEFRPRDPRPTTDARAVNRRVEVVVVRDFAAIASGQFEAPTTTVLGSDPTLENPAAPDDIVGDVVPGR